MTEESLNRGDSSNGASKADVSASLKKQDIFNATSVAEIQAALKVLKEQDLKITGKLETLISSQRDLSHELGRLDLIRAHLGSQVTATRSISNGMLSEAATSASRISEAVQRLDLEQSRVKATLDVVEQVADLKACVLGVNGSMGAPQDWETAPDYLHRASKIPPEIVTGRFAEEMIPTSEVPDSPSITLELAAQSLCGLFLREFEKAAKENDGARVTRFFKLFPLIGKSDVGLDIYGRYVCQGVASRARANLNSGTGGAQRKEGYFYANALTKLFEHIAQIIEGHGSLVERHYGVGRMIKVMARLQIEADIQGGILLDAWSEERNIDRRLTDIKSYAFSFLVQSFLPAQRPSSSTPRTSSPAYRDAGARNSEDEGVDMKEIDSILSEMAVMLTRWSLYTRFLGNKVQKQNHENEHEKKLVFPDLLAQSSLSGKVSDRLSSPFDMMTTFFFRRSVEKAFQLDEFPSDLSLSLQKPPSNPPFITSAVDDTMYIVNKVIQRSLTTGQTSVITAVFPTIARVLGSDFVGMIQRKMRDENFPRAPIQGARPPDDKVIAFLVLINNLDVAASYVQRIVSSHTESANGFSEQNESENTPINLVDVFPFGDDATRVTQAMKSLESSFEQKTSELAGDGIQVTFSQVIKPRLRPIVADAFRDIDYLATENELSELARLREEDGGSIESDDAIVQTRFSQGWETLVIPIKRILTERSYDKLLNLTASYLSSKILEKRIWAYQGRINELGAVRLERAISAITNTVARGERYNLRDAFTRCLQICIIMNMEEEEWEEMQAIGQDIQDGILWKLNSEEQMRARNMVREVQ